MLQQESYGVVCDGATNAKDISVREVFGQGTTLLALVHGCIS